MDRPTQEIENTDDGATGTTNVTEYNTTYLTGVNEDEPVAFLKVEKWSSSEEHPKDQELSTMYPIYYGANIIGRAPVSSICFPFSFISTRHACIDVKQTLHTVRDCISTNKTKRNGVDLEPEIRYELVDGVNLSFADIHCSYHVANRASTENQMKPQTDVQHVCGPTSPPPSHQASVLSAGTGTAGLTLLQNFLEDDDSNDELKDDLNDTEDATKLSGRNQPDVGNGREHQQRKLASLTVLAEESQCLLDDRQYSTSLFGRGDSDIPPIIGETEQYIADNGDNCDIGQCEQEQDADGVQENESSGSKTTGIAEETQQEAIDQNTTDNISNEKGEQEITEMGGNVHGQSASSTGAALTRLNSLTVDSRLSGYLATSTLTTSGDASTRPPATDEKPGTALTSLWSDGRSDASSGKKGRTKSLLNVAVDNWLFRSEPDLRRRYRRNKGKQRASADHAKSSFDQLLDKCNKWTIAAKRASKDRKAMEESREEEMEMGNLEELKEKKDPFEFGTTQLCAGEETKNSIGKTMDKADRGALADAKPGKARKSTKSSKGGKAKPADDVGTASPSSTSTKGQRAGRKAGQRQRGATKRRSSHSSDHQSSEEKQDIQESNIEDVPLKKAKLASKADDKVTEADPGRDHEIDQEKEDRSNQAEETVKGTKKTTRANRAKSTKTNQEKSKKVKTELKLERAENTTMPAKDSSNDAQADIPLAQLVKEKPNKKRRQVTALMVESTEDHIDKPKTKPKKATKNKPEVTENVKVCFTQMNSIPKRQLDRLEEIVTKLGGEVVDSAMECTHLVIPKFARSTKFMCAVARGIPILTPAWVEESKNADHFADTDEFVVKDDAEENKFGFNLRECLADMRKRIENGQGGLFDGFTFYSTASVRPNREEMKQIINSAGGEFLLRLAKLPRSGGGGTFVVLSCDQDANSADIKRSKQANVPVVSMEFVFTGLLKREVDVEKYRLFNDDTGDETTMDRKGKHPGAGSTTETNSQGSSSQRKKGRGKQ